MEIFDVSQKTTKELEERLDYLFNVAVDKNKERISCVPFQFIMKTKF